MSDNDKWLEREAEQRRQNLRLHALDHAVRTYSGTERANSTQVVRAARTYLEFLTGPR